MDMPAPELRRKLHRCHFRRDENERSDQTDIQKVGERKMLPETGTLAYNKSSPQHAARQNILSTEKHAYLHILKTYVPRNNAAMKQFRTHSWIPTSSLCFSAGEREVSTKQPHREMRESR